MSKNKKLSKMFPFITHTWNPLGGECMHYCGYCWARALAKRHLFKKYQGKPRIYEKILSQEFYADDFVFVCDMCDLFGDWVPRELIQRILDRIRDSPATFLLLTKNPKRYLEFALPSNCVAGATIETDLEDDNDHAPPRNERIEFMKRIRYVRKMVSVEPVLKFSEFFADRLVEIRPDFIAIGYDNYKHNLPEPSMPEVNELIVALCDAGIKIYRKTMR